MQIISKNYIGGLVWRMIVLAALDDHFMILHCDHTRLALMRPSSGARPVGFCAGRLVAGEGKISDLKLTTAAKSCYVGVVGHCIY